MNTTQVTRYRLWIAAFFVLMTVTACVPPRIGVSWPALSTLEIAGEETIVVSYANQMNAVDPKTGAALRLLDSEGRPLSDAEGNARTWVLDGMQLENAQFFSNPIPIDDDSLLVVDYTSSRLLRVNVDRAVVEDPSVVTLGDAVLTDIVWHESTFYIPYQHGGVAALDPETYDVIWTGETQEGVWSPPLIEGGVLYASSLDHFLYAFDLESGETLWSVDLEGGITATPTYSDGHLYVGSFNHKVYDISTRGEILASYDTQDWVWGPPTLAGDVLYAVDLKGFVYALDVTNELDEIWSVQVAQRGIRAAPLVTEEYVIVAGRDGGVYWLDPATGAVLFDRQIEGQPEILSDILLLEPSDTLDIPEPLVVVSTVDTARMLVAYSLENGRAYWTYGR